MATGPSVLEDGAWQERAFVTIQKKGGSAYDFHSDLSEIGFSGGSKDVEGQPLMNGGRMTQYSSQEDFEFSGTLYMSGVSAEDSTGIASYFHGSDDQKDSNTGQYEYETSLTRDDFVIAVLFTNDTAVDSALDDVASGSEGYRFICADAKLTEYEQNFDDMVLQVEVTFIIPPFDVAGNSRVVEQEQTDSASAALSVPTDGAFSDYSFS